MVSDITYIRRKSSWLYLTTAMDLWSRESIGRRFSSTIKTEETALPALRMATGKRCLSALLFSTRIAAFSAQTVSS